MATNYPTALDTGTTLPNPSASNATNSPSHASLHDNENAAIIATQTKLGTGNTAAASNTLLVGTGAGTSAWQGLTSAQLASILSDDTGTGSAVFANTPTLITPKVDTISESTPSNGVTVGGVSLKSGVLNTANSVVTSNIADNAITGSKLATNTIMLGYAQITASFTTASTTQVQVTGLTSTVTIPAGSRSTKITAWASNISNGAVSNNIISIWDGAVGSGTQLAQMQISVATTNGFSSCIVIAKVSPTAGSKTYNVGAAAGSNTLTMTAATTAPAFILVEAI